MDQPAPDNSKSRRKSFQKQSFARERALDSVTPARPAPIDMPALVAGAVSFGIASRVASPRGSRGGSVPAVASAPDRRSVARVVSSGARVRNRRPLGLRGRDAPTRVAAARAYAPAADYWTHITKPGENLHFIGVDYGVTVEALRLANGLRHATGDVIYEGQEIRVPVTDGNRDKIELIRAKAIVAKEQAIARAAAERARKTGNKQCARKQDKAPDGSEAWRAPYRSMRRGEVTAVTRAEVEAMMPKPGPSPPGLEHARGLRDADVVLLVEMPECEWCARVRPTWRRLAETFGDAAAGRAPAAASAAARDVRVCAFLASSPEDRAWADTHLAAHAFPTVIAMPKRGGVYKYAGADRDLPKLRAFADAAFRAGAPSRAVAKPSAEHLASSALNALAPNIQVADTVERALVGVIGAKPASVAADAVATATPFALFGFGVALLLSTFRRALAGAFARPPGGGTRARGVADAASAYYESGAGGPGGSAQAAAARLDAAGFGYPAAADEGPRASGAPIAPAAAARSQSAREAERAAVESERRRTMEQSDPRARRRDETAIPKGASVEKLGEWIIMVEQELGDIFRRFFFLLGAWFRLQRRLWGARFAPPPRPGSGEAF